jgi:hypothetical protein
VAYYLYVSTCSIFSVKVAIVIARPETWHMTRVSHWAVPVDFNNRCKNTIRCFTDTSSGYAQEVIRSLETFSTGSQSTLDTQEAETTTRNNLHRQNSHFIRSCSTSEVGTTEQQHTSQSQHCTSTNEEVLDHGKIRRRGLQ